MKVTSVICLLLLGCGVVIAQEPSTTVPSGQGDSQTLLNKLNNIEAMLAAQMARGDSQDAKLNALIERVAANEAKLGQHSQALAGMDEVLTKLSSLQETTAQSLAGINSRLTEVDDKFDVLAERLAQLEVRQGQILRQSSSGDGFVLNIRGQMSDPEFRNEFADAVDNSIGSRSGTFVVTNKMSTSQTIKINGASYSLSPGQTSQFPVKAGTVATELASEGVKTWLIGAPDYKQSIDIVPAPAARMTYRMPIYIEPIYLSRPILTTSN